MITYIDNAATTKIRPEVLNAMYESELYYGNPSSKHDLGKESKQLIESARTKIANAIGSKPCEIIFTSGATESNNTAIRGIPSSVVTSTIEHESVLNAVRGHKRNAICVDVSREGIVDIDELERALSCKPQLISIMFANNEIGTIQPIKEIGKIARKYKIYFHTDAVSAIGHCDIDVNELGIDMLSFTGHKIHGPKGAGVLYVRQGIKLSPLLYGGPQELGLRAGTENTSGIVGLGKAVELLNKSELNNKLKDKLKNDIKAKIPNVKFNGSPNGLSNILSVTFNGANAQKALTELSKHSIYASDGSARTTGVPHVLTAIGLSDTEALSTIRFSFGIYNTENDVEHILRILPGVIYELRKHPEIWDIINEKENTNMKHVREDARRQAYNTLAEVTRHLDNPRITKDPKRHHMLTDMKEKATRTLENLDRMDERMDYRETNVGYNRNDDMRRTMDAINRVLPHLNDWNDDWNDDAEMRRGVPGSGRGRNRGRQRDRYGRFMDDRTAVDDRRMDDDEHYPVMRDRTRSEMDDRRADDALPSGARRR